MGIIASGVSCLVLGSADFVFAHPVPGKGSPAGDGILTSNKDIVLLRGTEGAVNSILGVSALYNASLSSLDSEKIHRKLLFERVLKNPRLTKYTLCTRTTAVVFMLLVLKLQDPTGFLDELLPNDTKVWRQWKATILEQLRLPNYQSFLSESKVGRHVDGFSEQEQDLLELLYEDARAAYNGYRDYLRVDSL